MISKWNSRQLSNIPLWRGEAGESWIPVKTSCILSAMLGKCPVWSAQEGREKKLNCFLEQKTQAMLENVYKWVIDTKISEILLLVAVMTHSLLFPLISLLFTSIICFGFCLVGVFCGFFGRIDYLSRRLALILLSQESRITTFYMV